MPVGPFEFGEELTPMEGGPVFQVRGIRGGRAVPVGARVPGGRGFYEPVEPGIRGVYTSFFQQRFKQATTFGERREIVRMARESLGRRGIRGAPRVPGGGGPVTPERASLRFVEQEYSRILPTALKGRGAERQRAQAQLEGLQEELASLRQRTPRTPQQSHAASRGRIVETPAGPQFRSVHEAAYGRPPQTPFTPEERRQLIRRQAVESVGDAQWRIRRQARVHQVNERFPARFPAPEEARQSLIRQRAVESVGNAQYRIRRQARVNQLNAEYYESKLSKMRQRSLHALGREQGPIRRTAALQQYYAQMEAQSVKDRAELAAARRGPSTPLRGAPVEPITMGGGGGGRVPPKAPPAAGAPIPPPDPRRSAAEHLRAGRQMEGAANPVHAARAKIVTKRHVMAEATEREQRVVAEEFARRGLVPSEAMERAALERLRANPSRVSALSQMLVNPKTGRFRTRWPESRNWVLPKWEVRGVSVGRILESIPGGIFGATVGGAIGGMPGVIAGATLGAIGPSRLLRTIGWRELGEGAVRGAGATMEGAAGLAGRFTRGLASAALGGGNLLTRAGIGAAVGGYFGGLPGAGVGAAFGMVPTTKLGMGGIMGAAKRLGGFAVRHPTLAGVAIGALAAIPALLRGAREAVSPAPQILDAAYADTNTVMGLDPDNLNTQGLVLSMHYARSR